LHTRALRAEFSEGGGIGYAVHGAYQMAREQAQVKALSLIDVLEPLSAEELEELADRCPNVRLQKGEDFYRPKKDDGGLFLIEEGRVRVYKVSPQGEVLTLAIVSSGTALSARRLQGLYAQAMEPSVLAFMSRAELEHLVRKKPEVGLRLADLLAERLRLMDARMSDVIHKEVPARLASFLLQLLSEEGIVVARDYVILGPYTHEQLGTMIGAKRVAVARAFRRLREAGAVEVEHYRIRVTDLEALEHIAREGR